MSAAGSWYTGGGERGGGEMCVCGGGVAPAALPPNRPWRGKRSYTDDADFSL